VPFPTNTKVKGDGQECPPHTGKIGVSGLGPFLGLLMKIFFAGLLLVKSRGHVSPLSFFP
jgi:hypothetical protein